MNIMTANQGFDISHLVDDLKPVTPLRTRRGIGLAMAATLTMLILILTFVGLRGDIIAGKPNPMFLIRSGTLALLGIATGHAVLSMASPAVGKQNFGWYWALGAAFLFPAAATIMLLLGAEHVAFSQADKGLKCLAWSGAGALLTSIPMVYWLRKGAPTSAERAGWLTGIASGGLGAFAFNFYCAFNDIVYIGLWYSLAVGLCAVAGRLIVPRLIRW